MPGRQGGDPGAGRQMVVVGMAGTTAAAYVACQSILAVKDTELPCMCWRRPTQCVDSGCWCFRVYSYGWI